MAGETVSRRMVGTRPAWTKRDGCGPSFALCRYRGLDSGLDLFGARLDEHLAIDEEGRRAPDADA